jgi:hypothetical protein
MARSIGVALMLLVATGCGAVRPQPLDLGPGQHIVLGGIDLSGFEVTEGIVDIVRDDQTFQQQVRAGLGAREFAIGLPPGRYRVTQLRASHDSRSVPNQVIWDLGLTFQVDGGPAVYVGTLRVDGAFAGRLRYRVLDELDDTLRILRGRYTNMPVTANRVLMAP